MAGKCKIPGKSIKINNYKMEKTTINKIILLPRLNNPGGVSNYYSVLKPYLSDNFTYVLRGKDSAKNKIRRIITDYIKFYKIVSDSRYIKVVLINSSLGYGGFFRDGLYSLITPKSTKRIIFYRGWNPSFEKIITTSWLLKFWFRNTFLKADHIIVLSSEFKAKLQEWGYKGPISIETTLVDEQLLNGQTWDSVFEYRAMIKQPSLLYLGNVSRAKGVWEIVDSLNHFNGNSLTQDIRLIIAGAGQQLKALQKYTKNNGLNVTFLGYVRDKQKAQAFKNGHIYIFASYHEGMPNSVLEAMAFGLPVITTRVGGIPDFFKEGIMGIYLDNREPEHITEKIEYLLERPELMKNMSEYNYNYAKEHFYAGKVAKRLENIINNVIE